MLLFLLIVGTRVSSINILTWIPWVPASCVQIPSINTHVYLFILYLFAPHCILIDTVCALVSAVCLYHFTRYHTYMDPYAHKNTEACMYVCMYVEYLCILINIQFILRDKIIIARQFQSRVFLLCLLLSVCLSVCLSSYCCCWAPPVLSFSNQRWH